MYALDLEATGTDPVKDRIIQIGLVNMDGGDMEGAHDAVNDAKATAEILQAMAKQWEKIHGLTAGEAASLCCYGHPPADPHGILVRIDGKVCYTHKRVRDVPVEDDIGYAGWMLQNDFPAATKRVLRAELERIHSKQDGDGIF